MTLLRPNPAAANPTGPIAIDGDDWKIQLDDWRFQYQLDQWGKETGAGDANTKYGHNALIDGRYVFRGRVVEGEIGVKHLKDRTKNPTPNPVTITMSTGRKQAAKLMFTDISGGGKAAGKEWWIVFTAVLHDTDPDTIEAAVI